MRGRTNVLSGRRWMRHTDGLPSPYSSRRRDVGPIVVTSASVPRRFARPSHLASSKVTHTPLKCPTAPCDALGAQCDPPPCDPCDPWPRSTDVLLDSVSPAAPSEMEKTDGSNLTNQTRHGA